MADRDLSAAELLADHSHEEAVRDCFRVLDGGHFRFEDNWTAAVAGEGGSIDEEKCSGLSVSSLGFSL